MNQEIKLKVEEINSLAGEIATLNKQINVVELSGTKANELRDRRSLLLDQLSLIVDVEVKEFPIMDLNQPDRETGAHRFIVKIAGGQTLVDGNEYNGLECVARTSYEKVNQTDIDGLYDVYWEDGQKFNLYNPSMGGNLQGLVQMRDGNNGEYFKGEAVEIAYRGDTTKVVIETNASYLEGMAKCNLSDTGGIINIGDQLFYYKDWSYDTETGRYTFTVDNVASDAALTPAKNYQPVSIGGDVNYQGVPYYLKQMNEWIRDFSKKVNDIFSAGITAEDPPQDAGILFTADKATSKEQFSEDELNDSRGNGKGYYYITAGNYAIVDELIKNPDLLGTRSDVDLDPDDDVQDVDGIEQCRQVHAVISMISDKNQFSFRGRNAGGFLECILSDATLNASNADTFYSTYLSLETNIDNQRTSISGVDEDEEALNLVKYENSYTLASKMINVLTEVYDRLILQTGV